MAHRTRNRFDAPMRHLLNRCNGPRLIRNNTEVPFTYRNLGAILRSKLQRHVSYPTGYNQSFYLSVKI